MTGKFGKILLVDDDEVFLTFMEVFLEEEYDTIPAKSVKEALECVNKDNVPDLILLDIMLPDMNGWEIFNTFKSISFLKNIPIAFLTSNSEPEDIDHAMEIGAADYIVKPCDKPVLLKKIQNIIKKNKSL